ncbi:50s ribosomal protein l4 [Stylonychia lemnae]|uniref:Large ribosomal subunit protein uL4m n=1 Tax=Stylonychia lemnae TaxID=5949 RepID=A0A078BED0_STYLE|nr:50s ribosomal protein l4 [Stylonychia lemnae]|eukprot:CDW91502.1 50s ribosomal protein l4 [Stylonychia lemnae]
MFSKQLKHLSNTSFTFNKVALLSNNSQRLASTFVSSQPGFDVRNYQLPKQSQQLIVERPWSTKPFNPVDALQIPVFDFKTGQFTGELCNLDQDIFNVPLRRDIVHRVYQYFMDNGRRTYKTVKTRGDVSGSGMKMRPQKKSGRARQGDKRAPHLKKGGKPHGSVPMDYTFPINEKLRLLALKTILSARLYEDKLVLIDNEKLEYPKTKYLDEILSPYRNDRILFLTPFEMDPHFKFASQNIETLNVMNPQQINVKPIIQNDWIFATKQSLQELEMIIECRDDNLFRNRKIPRESLAYDTLLPNHVARQERKRDRFDEDIIRSILEREDFAEIEDKPLQIVTESLKGYIQDLKELQDNKQSSQASL